MTIDVVDGAMKVDLSGNLNYINVVDFETRVLDAMITNNPDCVVVNVSKATYVDVDGIISLEKIFNRKKGSAVLIMETKDADSVLC